VAAAVATAVPEAAGGVAPGLVATEELVGATVGSGGVGQLASATLNRVGEALGVGVVAPEARATNGV
jgi:hypothetical protein